MRLCLPTLKCEAYAPAIVPRVTKEKGVERDTAGESVGRDRQIGYVQHKGANTATSIATSLLFPPAPA